MSEHNEMSNAGTNKWYPANTEVVLNGPVAASESHRERFFVEAGAEAPEAPYVTFPGPPRQSPQKNAEATGGLRFDEGKLPLHLVPTSLEREVAKVLQFAAKKYAPRNWEKGMAWSRVYASLRRHLMAFWDGEDIDPETDLMHLAHAACNVAFLIEYMKTHPDLDDRPKQSPNS